MDVVYFLEPSDKDLAGAVQTLVEKPRVDKPGTHSDVMHLIPFFLMKLHDKAKVEALFKTAKTSVDASVERLIKPVIINIEQNLDYDKKDALDLRIVQIATCHYFCKQWPKPMTKVLKLHKQACLQLQTTPDSHYLGYYALRTMRTVNMGKLVQTFADYHYFDFKEEVGAAVHRNFERSPELSAMLSGVTEQLAPIIGVDNKMAQSASICIQTVNQSSSPEADTQVTALVAELRKKVAEQLTHFDKNNEVLQATPQQKTQLREARAKFVDGLRQDCLQQFHKIIGAFPNALLFQSNKSVIPESTYGLLDAAAEECDICETAYPPGVENQAVEICISCGAVRHAACALDEGIEECQECNGNLFIDVTTLLIVNEKHAAIAEMPYTTPDGRMLHYVYGEKQCLDTSRLDDTLFLAMVGLKQLEGATYRQQVQQRLREEYYREDDDSELDRLGEASSTFLDQFCEEEMEELEEGEEME